MFNFSTGTGVKAAPVTDWPELFGTCARVHDVRDMSQLKAALSKLADADGLRFGPGVWDLSGYTLRLPQAGLVVGPSVAGKPGDRQTKLINGRAILSGHGSVLGGVQFSAPKAPANMIQLNAPATQLLDADLIDITTASDKSRVVLISQHANDAYVRGNVLRRVGGYVVVMDSPKGNGVARRVGISYNEFDNCHSMYFQAGQWGNAEDVSDSWFTYNKVTACYSAELKVSMFKCYRNRFEDVVKGFNLRIGKRSTVRQNLFIGGERASRIFGTDHYVEGNIIQRPQFYALILCEGSLAEQFRVHPNAHHVRAEDVSIENNYIEHGVRGGILIGDRQTGMLGTGSRTARKPTSSSWPHYEPYSPSDIEVTKNTFVGHEGRSIALRTPDTAPATADKYPMRPSLNKYYGIEIRGNKYLISGVAIAGDSGGDGFEPWQDEAGIEPWVWG